MEVRMPAKKKENKFKWMKIALMSCGFLIFALCVMYIGLLMSGESLLKNNIQKLDLDQASIVFDEKDESITALFRENRQVIRYQDIPPLIRNAFIAVEDKRFYEHTGIDYRCGVVHVAQMC
jgi:penicillin-binding protein 2A